MQEETARKISSQEFSKGDVFGVARIAAIQGAKRTSELVPLADEVLLGAVEVDFEIGKDYVVVISRVESRDGRSVAIEALAACAIAALTIYDMCKAVDRSMSMNELALIGT